MTFPQKNCEAFMKMEPFDARIGVKKIKGRGISGSYQSSQSPQILKASGKDMLLGSRLVKATPPDKVLSNVGSCVILTNVRVTYSHEFDPITDSSF